MNYTIGQKYLITVDDWFYAPRWQAISATINGNQIDIYKDPKTDDGTKKSAKGLLMVTNINGSFELMDQVTPKEEARGCLEKVFENGKLLKKYSLMEVRNLVKAGIDKEIVKKY